jgi:hypothetical protein
MSANGNDNQTVGDNAFVKYSCFSSSNDFGIACGVFERELLFRRVLFYLMRLRISTVSNKYQN